MGPGDPRMHLWVQETQGCTFGSRRPKNAPLGPGDPRMNLWVQETQGCTFGSRGPKDAPLGPEAQGCTVGSRRHNYLFMCLGAWVGLLDPELLPQSPRPTKVLTYVLISTSGPPGPTRVTIDRNWVWGTQRDTSGSPGPKLQSWQRVITWHCGKHSIIY
jgi:hypothetical protein